MEQEKQRAEDGKSIDAHVDQCLCEEIKRYRQIYYKQVKKNIIKEKGQTLTKLAS